MEGKMEGKIKRRYSNYKLSGSFSGAAGFKKDSGTKASLGKVKSSLVQIPSYTLHHPARVRFPRRRVYIGGMHEQYCMDLKDIQSSANFNNKKRYLVSGL